MIVQHSPPQTLPHPFSRSSPHSLFSVTWFFALTEALSVPVVWRVEPGSKSLAFLHIGTCCIHHDFCQTNLAMPLAERRTAARLGKTTITGFTRHNSQHARLGKVTHSRSHNYWRIICFYNVTGGSSV